MVLLDLARTEGLGRADTGKSLYPSNRKALEHVFARLFVFDPNKQSFQRAGEQYSIFLLHFLDQLRHC